jgi:glycosyltransferase involved in cell wall biosynthesis
VLHVPPGLGSGGAGRVAADLMPTLNRERFEAGVIGLLDPPFGTDLEETLAQDVIPVRQLGERRGFGPRTFVRLVRVLERVGSALSPHLQGFTQRAPSLDEHEEPPLIRVVHVVSDFSVGGAERVAADLLRTLDPKQFEARAISLGGPFGSALEEILAQDGIPVWYMGKERGFDPLVLARVTRIMEHFRPQVVHTHTYALRYAFPYMLCRRIPAMVHTVHNLAERELEWYERWVHRLAFRRGVLPVAIAREVADSIRRVYGIEDFPLIPNGIPVDTFRGPSTDAERWRNKERFAPTDVLFVCVAVLRPQKNPALLLEAFHRGPASDPRAHLLFVGEGGGALESELERQIGALGLQERVHLLGLRSDIPEILNAADVFVLSSDYEGNPLAVLEAMAAGKPVISTAVGGVPELVEGGCGLLVPPREAQALSKAMRYMLERPEARKSMGEASARRAVERFDLRVMTEAYEDLYMKLIANNRSQRKNAQPSGRTSYKKSCAPDS